MSERAEPRLTPLPAAPGSRREPSVRIELWTSSPGSIHIPPVGAHRLQVHAGPPVRGSCRVRRYRYTRGDIDFMPAGTASAWVVDDATRSLMVELPPEILRATAEQMDLDPDRWRPELRHQFRDPQIEHVAWALEAEHAAGYPNGPLYIDSLAMALAIRVLGDSPSQSHAGLMSRQLRRVTEHIEAHLDQNLSLLRLAKIAEASPTQLKAAFKRAMGTTVHQYIVRRRVERAMALLARGELAASQVALETGFAHQSHMARWMRRVAGVTPRSLTNARAAPDRPEALTPSANELRDRSIPIDE